MNHHELADAFDSAEREAEARWRAATTLEYDVSIAETAKLVALELRALRLFLKLQESVRSLE